MIRGWIAHLPTSVEDLWRWFWIKSKPDGLSESVSFYSTSGPSDPDLESLLTMPSLPMHLALSLLPPVLHSSPWPHYLLVPQRLPLLYSLPPDTRGAVFGSGIIALTCKLLFLRLDAACLLPLSWLPEPSFQNPELTDHIIVVLISLRLSDSAASPPSWPTAWRRDPENTSPQAKPWVSPSILLYASQTWEPRRLLLIPPDCITLLFLSGLPHCPFLCLACPFSCQQGAIHSLRPPLYALVCFTGVRVSRADMMSYASLTLCP